MQAWSWRPGEGFPASWKTLRLTYSHLLVEVPLEELPRATEHLVLASVGRTDGVGGQLPISDTVIACQKSLPAEDGFAFPWGPRRIRSTSALGATPARALHRLGVRNNSLLRVSIR